MTADDGAEPTPNTVSVPGMPESGSRGRNGARGVGETRVMGNERIDEDPIQMQPVLSMRPEDAEAVRSEPSDGGAPRDLDEGHDDHAAPTPR
jgi:hypothetical protein